MAGMFTKTIAPKTPVAADLGGPPAAAKPHVSKKPASKRLSLKGGRR